MSKATEPVEMLEWTDSFCVSFQGVERVFVEGKSVPADHPIFKDRPDLRDMTRPLRATYPERWEERER